MMKNTEETELSQLLNEIEEYQQEYDLISKEYIQLEISLKTLNPKTKEYRDTFRKIQLKSKYCDKLYYVITSLQKIIDEYCLS